MRLGAADQAWVPAAGCRSAGRRAGADVCCCPRRALPRLMHTPTPSLCCLRPALQEDWFGDPDAVRSKVGLLDEQPGSSRAEVRRRGGAQPEAAGGRADMKDGRVAVWPTSGSGVEWLFAAAPRLLLRRGPRPRRRRAGPASSSGSRRPPCCQLPALPRAPLCRRRRRAKSALRRTQWPTWRPRAAATTTARQATAFGAACCSR